jgi:hypothetical protein
MGNHRFGTTMIEAHVTTTIRENYFRWMFQILADPKCMPEPDMAANFKTEYDLQEQEDFPENLACSLAPLARLPKTCQIRYCTAETAEAPEGLEQEVIMGSFTILTEEKDEEDYKELQQDQRQLIIKMASRHGKEHKHLLELMRSQVKLVRENCENLDSKGLKKAHADAKKKLRLYGNDEERPKKKRRKSGNKSRCSNKKINIFDQNKTKLDGEENKGYREAWEVMYRKIMSKYVVEDSDDDDDEEGEGQMSAKWLKHAPLEDVASWDEV